MGGGEYRVVGRSKQGKDISTRIGVPTFHVLGRRKSYALAVGVQVRAILLNEEPFPPESRHQTKGRDSARFFESLNKIVSHYTTMRPRAV